MMIFGQRCGVTLLPDSFGEISGRSEEGLYVVRVAQFVYSPESSQGGYERNA